MSVQCQMCEAIKEVIKDHNTEWCSNQTALERIKKILDMQKELQN